MPHLDSIKATPEHLSVISSACSLLILKKSKAAISKLESLPAANRHDEWYFLRGRCAIIENSIEEAYYFFEQIENIYDAKFFNIYLEFLRENRFFVKEIVVLENHPQKFKHKKIMLRLAKCYTNSGLFENARLVYDEAIRVLPIYRDVKMEFIRFLIKNNQPGLLDYLRVFIQEHHYNYNFRLIYIQQCLKKNEMLLALFSLQEAFQQSPYILEFHALWIEYYVMNANIIHASLQIQYALWLFQFSDKAIEMVANLQTRFHVLRYPIELLVPYQVLLPTDIQCAFALLSTHPHQVYLVGSCIHNLLQDRRLDYYQDIDFVTDATPLHQTQFLPSPYYPRLFSAFIQNFHGKTNKIDCYVSTASPEKFIHDDVQSRDFTINSFYCDRHGYIYDSTGLAYYDFYFRNLRTIKPPALSFVEDPIRLIRAIKYILMGYIPTPEVDFAIRQWQMTGVIPMEHIFAVTRKILKSYLKLDFVQALIEFGLLQKLYDIPQEQTFDESVLALEQKISP